MGGSGTGGGYNSKIRSSVSVIGSDSGTGIGIGSGGIGGRGIDDSIIGIGEALAASAGAVTRVNMRIVGQCLNDPTNGVPKGLHL